MQVQGWAFQEVKKPLSPLQWDSPALLDDHVLVKVHGCGVCHTDLGYVYDGVPIRSEVPLVLGHEIAGEVVDVGAKASKWLGAPVIVSAVIPCGNCSACTRGRPGICSKQIFPGNDIPGGFASHVVVPTRGLCRVAENVDTLNGSLAKMSVIADAVTTPLNAVIRSGLSGGDVAVFVGVGGLGIFGAQIARTYGAHVIILDVCEKQLDKARSIGFDNLFNTSALDNRQLKKMLRELAGRNGWPKSEWKIFETSGHPGGQETAYSLINFGATLMVVGYTMSPVKIRLSNLMAFEARAEGVWGCPPSLYCKAVDLVKSGAVQINPFIEERPLSEINEVFESVHKGEINKRVVLIP